MANQSNKPKVIKDYNKLEKHLQEQIKLIYSEGFADYLIHFYDAKGKMITALPFETEDKQYLLRMTEYEAVQLIDDDDDFDDEGFLKDEVKQDYTDKYSDVDHVMEQMPDEDEED